MDVARTGDQITQMNGNSKALRAGDMMMRDADGVCCSIIYGQDNRSPIIRTTTGVLYVAYAPAGVPTELVSANCRALRRISTVRAGSGSGAAEFADRILIKVVTTLYGDYARLFLAKRPWISTRSAAAESPWPCTGDNHLGDASRFVLHDRQIVLRSRRNAFFNLIHFS